MQGGVKKLTNQTITRKGDLNMNMIQRFKWLRDNDMETLYELSVRL